MDRTGIARDILQKILDNKINLSDLRVETHPTKSTATIHLIVDVRGIQQLDSLATAIRNISDVHTVQRQNHRRTNPIAASYNVTELAKSKSQSKRDHNSSKGRRAKSE